MELLIMSKGRYRVRKVSLGPNSLLVIFLIVFIVTGGAFYAGSYFTLEHSADAIVELYRHVKKAHLKEIEDHRALIQQVKSEAENNLDALASRLSKLQGHIMRIDALGARLADMAGIDDIDFDITDPVGMGGPYLGGHRNSFQVLDFIAQLDELLYKIEDRSDKLTAMEAILINHDLQDRTLPAGSPVTGGWISSLFGWRADPISGKREFHGGIDFTGRPESLVKAVAAGIVTWSDRRPGYGNMIEISHGNGYITRYAHNKKNLVLVGDKVEKGQPVAVMGSSGRTTGTHVHFEVVHNGKHVDPKKYISVN